MRNRKGIHHPLSVPCSHWSQPSRNRSQEALSDCISLRTQGQVQAMRQVWGKTRKGTSLPGISFLSFCRVVKKKCGPWEGSPAEPGLLPAVCPTLHRPSNSTGPRSCLFLCSVESVHCLSHSGSPKGQGVAKTENSPCALRLRT